MRGRRARKHPYPCFHRSLATPPTCLISATGPPFQTWQSVRAASRAKRLSWLTLYTADALVNLSEEAEAEELAAEVVGQAVEKAAAVAGVTMGSTAATAPKAKARIQWELVEQLVSQCA